MTYYSGEFHRTKACACGSVFIGPRTQIRCADCATHANRTKMRTWRARQKAKAQKAA